MTLTCIPYRTLRDIPLRLPEEQVWRLAGVRRGAGEVRPAIRAMGLEAMERARQLIHPRVLWGMATVDELDAEGVQLADGYRFSSPTLAKLLRGAQMLAVALVTIGEELGQETQRLQEQGEILPGMLLDAVGSVAVGEAADHLRDQIAQEAARLGMEIGPSLAPGARFWPLEDQRVVFRLLPADEIGIKLSASCFILPEKSESFVIGLGKNLKVKDRPGAACGFCGRADCAFRERDKIEAKKKTS